MRARHFHPAHSYSYLLEGSQTISPDGKPPYTVKAGDLQHEAPLEVSATRTTDPTKVLVVRIIEKANQPRVWRRDAVLEASQESVVFRVAANPEPRDLGVLQ